MKKICRVVGNGICILSAVILIMAAAAMLLQIKPVVVMSGSMEPAIKTGSIAFIDLKDRNIKEGDIIAFEKAGMFITHRAIRRVDGGWVTKGDANFSEDPGAIDDKSIVGTTIFSIPGVGYVLGRPANRGI